MGQVEAALHDMEIERDHAREEAAEARKLLKAVHDYFESRRSQGNTDAPGHNHVRPGRWDISGGICAWCETWAKVRAWAERKDGDE
jgi:hypothetical protein